MECALCDPELEPVVQEGDGWRVVLNRNQNLLGKCLIATRRHVEEVSELSADEWAELHGLVTSVSGALRDAFAPERFNYAFLQNLDRHVHLHVIPRYGAERVFARRRFDDPDYPDHYAVPMPVVTLTQDETAQLAHDLRRRLET